MTLLFAEFIGSLIALLAKKYFVIMIGVDLWLWFGHSAKNNLYKTEYDNTKTDTEKRYCTIEKAGKV